MGGSWGRGETALSMGMGWGGVGGWVVGGGLIISTFYIFIFSYFYILGYDNTNSYGELVIKERL